MTTKDLAELIGKSEAAVNKMRQRGKGPAYLNVNGSIRYIPADVAIWLEECKVDRSDKNE